jgi:hypothetical protein
MGLWLRNGTLEGLDALQLLMAGTIAGMDDGAVGELTGLRVLILNCDPSRGIGSAFSSLRSLEYLSLEGVSVWQSGPNARGEEGVYLDRATNGNDIDYSGLCALKRLKTLELNGFSGKLPACLRDLQELVSLTLSGNTFTELPEAVGYLANLRVFIAFQNGASSCPRLNDECRLLYKVKHDMALAPNEIWKCRTRSMAGPIPESYKNLHQLEMFWVDGNFLNGTLPSWLGTAWPHLRSLDIFDNDFTGPLPTSLGNLKQLELLQLQENRYDVLCACSVVCLRLLRRVRPSPPMPNVSARSYGAFPMSGRAHDAFLLQHDPSGSTVRFPATSWPSSASYVRSTLASIPTSGVL